ncbi:MAG: hypothetical protein IT529_16450 [Burkholderiales bacterium]|nr:hypothetical protein [Burkholderiales bacterium]
MDVLVSDTSVVIDLERAQLIEQVFSLPYRFVVPDALYEAELKDYGGERLMALGLQVRSLSGEEVAEAQRLRSRERRISIHDSYALSLAKAEAAVLLAGEAAMRRLAEAGEVRCHGVLWVFDHIEENRCYQRDIARFIHAQMQEHYWEDAPGYEVKVSKGYSELKPSAYTCTAQEPPADYRVSPSDKSNMSKYLFGGFARCLYPVQKFDSDAERKLAVILERDALRWFKPAKGQFQIFYRQGSEHLEYQPDFVAEVDGEIYMLEPKASNEMTDPVVLAKKESAVKWCRNASDHAQGNGGKPWRYALIPHTAIAENMTLKALVRQYC